MSFGWWCKDSRGRDLFKGIQSQALGLGPNNDSATPAPYRVTDIRRAWIDHPYKETCREAAKDAIIAVQAMVRENLDSLTPDRHCPTCTCDRRRVPPDWWSADDCEKFLAINPEEVYRAGGGY